MLLSGVAGRGESPHLSVVVPVRNEPQCLGICLEALRGSTFRDHEIIVVDDASTDMSAAVAEMLGARVIRSTERCGRGLARNRGAAAARGRYLMFVDADVRVHPETLARAVAVLDADLSVDAVFGSYDARPVAPGAVSRYKNLLDHHLHQTGRAEARTFWAGCGAIRREVFLGSGGFADGSRRSGMEDIELGARLRRAGRRIALRPEIQATALRAWTIGSLLRSGVWDRATGIGLVRRDLYALFARQRGTPFLLAAISLHLLYSLCGVLGFAVGLLLDLGDRLRSRTKRDAAVAPVAPAP